MVEQVQARIASVPPIALGPHGTMPSIDDDW
jgi:hypothetical protein